MLRPQTWYLLLAALCALVCIIAGGGTTLQIVLLIVATVASLAIIPLFKNRRLQAALTLLPIVVLLAWYVLLALYAVPEIMHWNYALPAVAILALVMARKGIVHDEKVVRSLDRIR
ncbi:MAG: DUF4293 family protein [Prevotella sp.]|nr:DUF4293 family protein [Prevotella sp.]